MALTIEWNRRIENWRKELPRHFYRPLGVLDMSGFTTREHLTPEAALQGKFQADARRHAAGEPSGNMAGSRAEVTLPAEAAGKRIVVTIGRGRRKPGLRQRPDRRRARSAARRNYC